MALHHQVRNSEKTSGNSRTINLTKAMGKPGQTWSNLGKRHLVDPCSLSHSAAFFPRCLWVARRVLRSQLGKSFLPFGQRSDCSVGKYLHQTHRMRTGTNKIQANPTRSKNKNFLGTSWTSYFQDPYQFHIHLILWEHPDQLMPAMWEPYEVMSP